MPISKTNIPIQEHQRKNVKFVNDYQQYKYKNIQEKLKYAMPNKQNKYTSI